MRGGKYEGKYCVILHSGRNPPNLSRIRVFCYNYMISFYEEIGRILLAYGQSQIIRFG